MKVIEEGKKEESIVTEANTVEDGGPTPKPKP